MNFNKSSLYPLNLSHDNASLLAGILGCSIGSLPFTYLGLPLGTTRPRVVDFAPLVNREERRLTASSMFLPQGGRLTLINSVLSSIPTYYMCSLQLPVTVIKAIDTARKNCLWRGNNPSLTRMSLAFGDRICTTKDKGGMGVINLRVHNTALLLKHMVKFYNGAELPWVKLISQTYYVSRLPHLVLNKGSFWWRDITSLLDIFRGIAKCTIQSGATALFWNDLWNDDFKCTSYPNLFSVTLYKNDSVRTMCLRPMEDSFVLPLSDDACGEFLQLQEELNHLQLQARRSDVWSFIWGTGIYTAKRFYNLNYSSLQPPRPMIWLWKTKCVMKIKVFAWLLFCDRLNTRDMLDKRHCAKEDDDLTCALCNTHHQTSCLLHMSFQCGLLAAARHSLGL